MPFIRLCHYSNRKTLSTRYLENKVGRKILVAGIPSGPGNTLKCLSIGTPKIINFPFVSNGKFMVITCPSIQAHLNEAVLCLNFGTPENNEFSIWNKWKIYCFLVSQYLSTLGYSKFGQSGKYWEIWYFRANFAKYSVKFL